MTKYAIINIGGKQFKVTEGEVFQVERQQELNINVVAYYNGKEVIFGNPFLTNVKVEAVIEENKLAPKVTIQRFKAKSRHRRKKGHRQPMTVVRVESILGEGETATVKAVKKTEKTAKAVVAKVAEAKKAPVKKVAVKKEIVKKPVVKKVAKPVKVVKEKK